MSSSNEFTDYPGAIENLGYWYVFPTVRGKASTGKVTLWTIMVGIYDVTKNKLVKLWDGLFNGDDVSDEEYHGVIRVDFSYENGKVRDDPYTYIRRGKNLGRSNETNPFTQAMKEAHAKYVKATEKDGETEYIRPMLARELKETPIADWPVYVQCKFNGNRVMFALNGRDVIPYSRNLKPVNVNSRVLDGIARLYMCARKAFAKISTNDLEHYGLEAIPKISKLFLDGEMYAHGRSLQTLGKLRRKSAVEDTDTKYYFFDLYMASSPKMEYQYRYRLLKLIREEYGGTDGEVCFVKTHMAKDLAAVVAYEQRFVSQGYEGAMIRIPDSPYEPSNKGRHSRHLLKLKPRFQEEYEVIGFSGGESAGKEEGAILIIVDVDGHDLVLQPALPLEERYKLFTRYTTSPRLFKEELNGKMIKVYFDEKSDDGIPLRAKTKLEIRDEE